MVSIFGRIAQLQNLLELSIADSTPESIDQLARGIQILKNGAIDQKKNKIIFSNSTNGRTDSSSNGKT